jgi:hypothetical protein
MNKNHIKRLMVITAIILAHVVINAQEFPIAVGSDTTFSGGAVYGGQNGLAAVQGDGSSQYNINAQLIGAGGVLIGSRISLGSAGIMPGAIPIFDGTNYFLVWREFNGTLKGQLINTSGNLMGGALTISTNVSTQRPGTVGVMIADNEYLVVFTKTDNILYGQRVSVGGTLIGNQIQISSNLARDVSLSYDGNNYLVTWVEIIQNIDKDIFGQFVSKTGSLVGSNFLIDGGPNHSDNPTSLAFDGTRYLLVFHEQAPPGGNWFLLGRFISTSGAIEETITICDTSKAPAFPSVAFDEMNYLITWTELYNASLMGRFYNKSGIPIDTSFVIFGQLGDKVPVGGVGFGGGLYLAVATRLNSDFSDGDVYGRFIQPITDVEEVNNSTLSEYYLQQNYPNPFNPTTSISFNLPAASYVSLKVFDIIGREIATIVSEELSSGTYVRQWNAENLPSGVYFYRLQAGSFNKTKKLILLR